MRNDPQGALPKCEEAIRILTETRGSRRGLPEARANDAGPDQSETLIDKLCVALGAWLEFLIDLK